MSLTETLIGSALGIGARVLQGFSRRAIQREFDERLRREAARRQQPTAAPTAPPITPDAPITTAEPAAIEPETQALEQEFNRRLVEEFQRRRAEPQLPAPDTMQKLVNLWEQANGDPNVFLSWIGQFPDADVQAVANDPRQLERVVEELSELGVQQPGVTPQGVPEAPIGSSNVRGFSYDQNSGTLTVQFNGETGNGPVYQYGSVPPEIAMAFMDGNAAARTNGKNKFGSWFRGKKPSLGAAHWQYIRDNFPHQRVS